MVMLVILVLGAAAMLLSSFSGFGLKIERDKATADALVQAKEALIGIAVTYPDYPGSLPCPDTDNDGDADGGGNGIDCSSYIGRLPWKTLGLPDLRDATGERLWYTLSRNVRRYVSVRPLNSETTGTLNITGTYTANNLMAIVFAPGNTVAHDNPVVLQNRSDTGLNGCSSNPSRCASNYLEGSNPNPSTGSTPNLNYQNADPIAPFNDQLISITHEQLFPLIEKRIAREVKSCLDAYAQVSSNKYPWAVPVMASDYISVANTRFGRLPSSDSWVSALLDALAALQLALNNYSASNASTVSALLNAGSALETAADNAHGNQPTQPALSASITNQANQTGDKAQKLANLQGGVTQADVQSEINQANANLAAVAIWPPGCTIFSASNKYWADWKRLVFFQMADGYQPGSSGSCTTTCLKINGAGTYRAAVIVAGQQLTGAPARSDPDTTALPTPYLEGINPHTGASPAIDFKAYKQSDALYQTNNDVVLCLNGTNICP